MTCCQPQSKRGNTKKISLISKESGKHSENGKMFLVGEGGGGEVGSYIFWRSDKDTPNFQNFSSESFSTFAQYHGPRLLAIATQLT